jgi:16S rRNA (guanine527-N7)-methyltransferase
VTSDVSRETQDLIARYSGVPGLARFADILATRGVERGLIGPREVPRIWPRHLANCAVVAQEATDVIPTGAGVVDVGSGAGLPGLVWALVRPDLRITLLEPLLRRATFLGEVVADLGLDARVEVRRGRAEEVAGGSYDVVTSRAVARLPQLLTWSLPLARTGGWVVALKGSGAAQELEEAAGALPRLGGAHARIVEYGAGVVQEPTTVVLVQRALSGGTGRP